MGEADFITKTRDSLGPLIKKPPLTDKLLLKPPFRFLQDVIGNVVKTTKFATGLYTEAELSETHSEKDAKIAFLQKAIDLVQMVNGESLKVKPGKIVAGLEPELTNEFLQALAKAAKNRPDSSTYVQRVLSGEKLEKSDGSAASNKENRERRSSGTDKTEKKSSTSKEGKEKRNSSVDPSDRHSKERVAKEKEKPTKDSVDKDKKHKEKSSSKDKISSKDKPAEEVKSEVKKKSSSKEPKDEVIDDKKEKKKKPKTEDGEEPKKPKKSSKEKPPDVVPITNGHDSHDSHDELIVAAEEKPKKKVSAEENSLSVNSGTPALRMVSKSAKEVRNRPKDVGDDVDLLVKPVSQPTIIRQTQSARPGTASQRPTTAAPKIRRQELPQSAQNGRMESSKLPTANIIGDTTAGATEDENFIVESNPLDLLNEDVDGMAESLELDDNEVHGGLVKRILETKKGLEENLKGQERSSRPTIVFDAKERDRTRKETAKLQEFIQHLTKTSHPLGKIMDFLQEDIDSMIKEMNEWRAEYKRNEAKLLQEQSSIHSNVEPLKTKLSELDQQIKDQLDSIASVKRKIITNEDKIGRMVLSVSKK